MILLKPFNENLKVFIKSMKQVKDLALYAEIQTIIIIKKSELTNASGVFV